MPCSDESCGTQAIVCSICYRYYLSADNTSITIFITIIYCLASFSVVMDQFMFVQSCRRINYHDDLVLRTPTVSIGERMLDVLFKNQSLDGNSILEVKYPNCEKDIQDMMQD